MHPLKQPINNKKEEQYFYFFDSILTFHLYLFKFFDMNQLDKPAFRRRLESSLVQSLTLLWQMHVAIFSIKSLFLKAQNQYFLDDAINEKQTKHIITLLTETKAIAEKYPFLQSIDKIMYVNLLDQVLHYYTNQNIVIVKDAYPKPWLSNKYFSVNTKINGKRVDE